MKLIERLRDKLPALRGTRNDGSDGSNTPKLALNLQEHGIGWFLGKGAKLDGSLKLPCGAFIEGDFIGNLECSAGSIIIAAGAHFMGNLVANKIYIAGTVSSKANVRSQIIGHSTFAVSPSGFVDADTKSKLFVISKLESVRGLKEQLP